jgi:hypothetical protein
MRKAFVSILAGLTLGAVLTSGAFAQENTVTVDVGPTIFGLAMAKALDAQLNSMANEANDNSEAQGTAGSSGFGIAVQYERQITPQLSAAVRFAYVGLKLGMSVSAEDADANVTEEISAISIDAHGRFYPTGGPFFLDGALGYANMTTSIGGKFREYQRVGVIQVVDKEQSISFDAPRSFFKFGAKLGWRIAFGDGIRFVFEPALGYDIGIVGVGDLIGTKFRQWAKAHDADVFSDDDVKTLDDGWKMLESFIFVGGPRLSLSFGCNF